MFFKCKMCGGTLEFESGATIGVCDSCGTKQTLPRLDSDRRANLYDRANHFRRNNEFDKAAGIYEQILNEEPTDAEAYWSLVLCRYGIEYVEDPATHKRIPTINRTQFTSIYDDEDYKSALQHAGGYQRSLYEEEAATINDIQKGILAISQNEEPFDVFICYKETDANGRRTPDSVLANDIYHQLTQEGFKVFFARITLEDKLGTAYEPYIFAALNSAKVMVVLGTKPEYFNAAWVKNEWSRYLSLVNQSGGKKVLIPAYRDMDPYDLPEEFSHLQAQDMSKLGFLQDLIRGIKKITKVDEPKPMVKEKVVVSTSDAGVEPLLERAFIFLEDGNWQDANIYCEKVLDKDPKNAEAYLGKLMAELKIKKRKELANCLKPFDNNTNYGKVLRFGDEKLEAEMRGYIAHINERIEYAHLSSIYGDAIHAMNTANTESAYIAASEIFKKISGFKDADTLAKQCIIESKRLAEEKQIAAEKKRIAAEEAAKKRNRIIAILVPIIFACIAIWIVITAVIIPNNKYNSAVKLYDAGKYDEAIAAFKELNGYKDSEEQIAKCETTIKNNKYNKAMELIGSGDYEVAYALLDEIGDKKAVESSKYERAMTLIDTGDYEAAYTLLEETKDFDVIKKNKYDRAIALIDTGDYEAAYSLLYKLNYKDSQSKLGSIRLKSEKIMLSKAQVGSYVYFGSYEQDNDTLNGREDIEWLVLAKDGNRVLLVSRYGLDCQKYNQADQSITWENSFIRGWLNNTFLLIAFTAEEKAMIPSVQVSADKNSTTDKVFLLSASEAIDYFPSNETRKCVPTTYAIKQGVYTDAGIMVDGIKAASTWWLRSPGRDTNLALVVYPDGTTSQNNKGKNVANQGIAVRPVLWVNIDT